MKDARRRDSSPKRSAKSEREEPEQLPKEMVLRSKRLAGEGKKAVVISTPGKLRANLLIFDKLDYDLVGLGFNYPATLVDREVFILTGKGCQEAIRTLDFSRVELAHQPNWSFAAEKEDSVASSEQEYASGEEDGYDSSDEQNEEDSDYDPEDDSPEHFYSTLDSHEAKLKVDGWTFFIECVQVKADKAAMKEREYERLGKYNYMQTFFLVRRIVIDLDFDERKRKEHKGH